MAYDLLVIRKKRDDTKIRNVSDLPTDVRSRYRSDTNLGTVLRDYGVTTKSQLKKKLRK